MLELVLWISPSCGEAVERVLGGDLAGGGHGGVAEGVRGAAQHGPGREAPRDAAGPPPPRPQPHHLHPAFCKLRHLDIFFLLPLRL